MTIIVFLVDTSASMHQRAYSCGRASLLDAAKNAVETFIKVRQKIQESRGDRYMLLSFEESPHNIKSGFKENLNTFKNELKNLQCLELTTMGIALKNAFDVLNLNRMQSGIDTYGQGRCPFYLEPSVIILITDGGKYSSTTSVINECNLPMYNTIPGSELTREPFRWDQRLYALVLRLSGTSTNERDNDVVPSDHSPIDAMCEVTGGRSYCITSHSMLMQSIDNLVQKVLSGVVINFERFVFDTNTKESTSEDNQIDLKSCRKMIFVPRSAQKGFAVGFWPIPESFWPDINVSVLPPRSAHPNVRFQCIDYEPLVIENLPFDKYELEPCSLTQYILTRKQPTTCWQVFIANSCKNSELCRPFGYLKGSTNLTCVNLYVMPYNYPVLLPLLDEFIRVLRFKSNPEWNRKFHNYLIEMPAYYTGPLRRALTRMAIPNTLITSLIPESYDTTLSVTLLNYLKKIKNQAKVEFDRLCNEVLHKQHNVNTTKDILSVRVLSRRTLNDSNLVTHPNYQERFLSMHDQLNEFGGYIVALPVFKSNINVKSLRNPYATQRAELLEQTMRMRSNFLQPLNRMKLFVDDAVHSLPISEMGNYQEYLKRMTLPLREIEPTPTRRHMFGNPFKTDKRMMVDEADIDLVGASSTNNYKIAKRNSSELGMKHLPAKRKPGPIPKNYKYEPVTLVECKLDDRQDSSQSYTPEESSTQLEDDNEKRFPLENIGNKLNSNLVISDSNFNKVSNTKTMNQEKNSKSHDEKNVDPEKSVENDIAEHNLKIKRMLFTDVRKPGKINHQLFEHFKLLKGEFHAQEIIINKVYIECLRFKRASLAKEVIQFLQILQSQSGNRPGQR